MTTVISDAPGPCGGRWGGRGEWRVPSAVLAPQAWGWVEGAG